jgi:hypothetical protein
VLPLICALAFALVALFALPSGASAFNISGFSYTNSNQQAGGHPNTSIAFTRQGSESEDLRDVLLDLPTGVFPNPESVGTNKCTTALFNQDKCPTAAQVGTISADVKALSILPITAPGTIYILSPDAGQVATLGLALRPPKICILFVFCAVPQKIFLKTGVVIRTYEDSGIRTYTPGTPRTTSIAIPLIVATPTLTADITMNKLTLSFQSRANSNNNGNFFWVNSTSCVPAPAKVTITSYGNVNSSASVNNSPTGCNNVPFAPTVSVAPADIRSNTSSTLSYTLNIPDADATTQNALPKIADVDFPVGSGLDLNALTGVNTCKEAQLQAQTCPASSIIGNATAISKFLPPSLNGNVYAMGEGGPVGLDVPIGVQLIGPRNSVVIFRGTLVPRGDVLSGTARVGALFDRIPQLPFRSFTLNVTKKLYKNPATCTPATTTSKVTGFNGTTASSGLGTTRTLTNTYTPTDCDVAPDTNLLTAPPAETTNRQPEITFESTIPTDATFKCTLDGSTPQPCTSPYTPAQPLSDGTHTFTVRAYNGLTPDPSPATVTFKVITSGTYDINATVVPTTSAAAANPDLNVNVDVTGGQPQSFAIQFPKGFNASLSARTPCLIDTARAGNCATASEIGTSSLTVGVFINGAQTSVAGTGTAYLTDAPGLDDAGGIALKIELPGVGTFIAVGGANLVNNGNNQNLEVREFPTIVGGRDITVSNLKLGLKGSVGKFLTNPSECATSDEFLTSSTAFDGSQADPVHTPYVATNCAAVPFNPTITQELTDPVGGHLTGVSAIVTTQSGDAAIKNLKVVEPPSLAPNFPAFGETADKCPIESGPAPDSVFDSSQCPSQAIVGYMYIETPLLPIPLIGDVYLIDNNPLPWFGVKIDSPGIHLRLVGVTNTPQVVPSCVPSQQPSGKCQTQISAEFTSLPDVPLSLVNFVLDGPDRQGTLNTLSGQILRVASPGQSACASGPANSAITPYSKPTTPTNLTQTINVTGC